MKPDGQDKDMSEIIQELEQHIAKEKEYLRESAERAENIKQLLRLYKQQLEGLTEVGQDGKYV